MHLLLGQLLANGGVVAQIGLSADNQARDTGAVVVNLGEPFLTNVLEGRRRSHGKTDEKYVCLGVRQRAQTIVILLTSGVEQSQSVRLISNPVEAQNPSEQSSISPSGRGAVQKTYPAHSWTQNAQLT